MATRQERAQALLNRAAQLRARAARLEAEERTSDRKRRERVKYVLGAALLSAMGAGERTEQELRDLVDRHNRRASDRALFGLIEHPETSGQRNEQED